MKYILLLATCYNSFLALALHVDFFLTLPEESGIRYNISGNDFNAIHFEVNREYKILCHGWMGSEDTDWFINATQEFIKKRIYNVITVGYKEAVSDPLYIKAALHVPEIGKLVAEMIVKLNKTKGIPLNNFHLIGHSLGGHIVGIAGENVINMVGLPVKRVTGLDPAFPGFFLPLIPYTSHDRIIKGNAKYVDIIHTSFLGVPREIGDIDFFPNGGSEQTGCNKDISCNHEMATVFFILSIFSDFVSEKCEDFNTFNRKGCRSMESTLMGDRVDTNYTGKFYLKTDAELTKIYPWVNPNSQSSSRIDNAIANTKGLF